MEEILIYFSYDLIILIGVAKGILELVQDFFHQQHNPVPGEEEPTRSQGNFMFRV